MPYLYWRRNLIDGVTIFSNGNGNYSVPKNPNDLKKRSMYDIGESRMYYGDNNGLNDEIKQAEQFSYYRYLKCMSILQ